MEIVEEGKKPRHAKMVVRSATVVDDIVVAGNKVTYIIKGKRVLASKYVNRASSSSPAN